MTLRIPLIAALLLAVRAAARAEDQSRSGLAWMPGDAIRGAFSAHSLRGVYPNGNVWSEVISGSGATDYREGAKHWLGKWWVTAAEFCFAYPPPGLGGCFRVTRISVNCFELYDFSGEHGQADEPPNLANRWNGRMWLGHLPTTCEERPSS